jgi:hypothetical protein
MSVAFMYVAWTSDCSAKIGGHICWDSKCQLPFIVSWPRKNKLLCFVFRLQKKKTRNCSFPLVIFSVYIYRGWNFKHYIDNASALLLLFVIAFLLLFICFQLLQILDFFCRTCYRYKLQIQSKQDILFLFQVLRNSIENHQRQYYYIIAINAMFTIYVMA